MDNFKIVMENLNRKIVDIFEMLVWDEWDATKTKVYDIVGDLQKLMDIVLQDDTDEIKELQNNWVVMIEYILRAVELEDSIQLADLLQCDLANIMEETKHFFECED